MLWWVSNYYGIKGNEVADKLVNITGTLMIYMICNKINGNNLRTRIKRHNFNIWDNECEERMKIKGKKHEKIVGSLIKT